MERQRRLFGREVLALFIVDELSLQRLVGSADIMAAQMRHLSAVASKPNVTLRVLPAVAYPANASALIERMAHSWTGASPPVQTPTAAHAQRVASAEVVLVRDTTDRDGATLAFTAESWRAFTVELKQR